MKYRVILAADMGKILIDGEKREYMVYIDSNDGMPDTSMWIEVDEESEGE